MAEVLHTRFPLRLTLSPRARTCWSASLAAILARLTFPRPNQRDAECIAQRAFPLALDLRRELEFVVVVIISSAFVAFYLALVGG